ncbi:SpoIIAA family protein [Chelativorans intermedius]|uniref:STAS/SEC14 domain-containing protein n=1 Tax=Chelativorans intermedius TaxID=515947 RepID=A0ABV6DA20_9HYPH|nr:STAS/SEC14 domain-containing protein [Chelativorans intermedius]MCT8999685.1 STAS/SEC14 domain-containing protein [Chelativorans intermedius]
MFINENPPRVRRIDTDREDTYAFEVTGHITAADVENLYGLLEGAYELHDRIDVIVIFHDYEGVDWNAAWKDQGMRGKTGAFAHIRKCAVVGGPAWLGTALALLGPLFSAEVKHFEARQEAAAWAWVGANPA